MGQFGGWGKFGGGFQFGGSRSRAEIYYHLLKRLGPPGLRPLDDDALTNKLLRADCQGLGAGWIHVDRLFAEIFPHTAAEDLPEWETLLGVVPPLGATQDQRRAAILARWRGAAGASLPELRAMLYPLLQPTAAWRDSFDDGYLNPRWNVAGAGTYVEGTPASMLQVEASAATDCSLDGVTNNGELITQRLHDISDDWTLIAYVDTFVVNAGTFVGLVGFRDYDNWYQFGLYNGGGSDLLAVSSTIEGTKTEDVDSASIAAPATSFWIQMQRLSGEMIFKYGSSLDSLAELQRVDVELVPREVGLVARNGYVSQNLATIDIDSIGLVHATPENNVTIIELTDAETTISGNADDIFTFFVHRASEDGGTYDIKNAQRQIDRAKQGHTLGTVGESDVFLCDDDESLTDRDILGS